MRFRMMPAEWGTITLSGWLTLDPMLLTLPKELGAFLPIVHEEERERELRGYMAVKSD